MRARIEVDVRQATPGGPIVTYVRLIEEQGVTMQKRFSLKNPEHGSLNQNLVVDLTGSVKRALEYWQAQLALW